MGPIAKNRTDGILIQHNIEDLEKEVHLGRSRPAEGNQAIKRITVPLGTQEIAVTSPLQTVSGNDGNLTADGNEDNSQETGATLRDKSSGQRKTNTTKTASLLKMTSSKKNVQRGGSFKMSHIVVAVCGCLAAYLALKLYPQFLARGGSPAGSCSRSLLHTFTTLAPSTKEWKTLHNGIADDLVTSYRLQPLSIVFACSKNCDFTNSMLSTLNGARDCILDLGGEEILGGGQFGDLVAAFLSRRPDGIILIRNMEKAHVSLVNKLADALSDLGSIRSDKSVATGHATFIITTEVPERLFNEGRMDGVNAYDFGDKVKTHLLKTIGAIKAGKDENSVSLRRRLMYVFPSLEKKEYLGLGDFKSKKFR